MGRLRPGRAWLAAGLLLCAPGCYVFHFGRPPDETVVHQEPEDVPRERWVRREPAVDAVFEGLWLSRGEDEPTRDESASFRFSRLLRKSGVFATLRGPDVAAPAPSRAPALEQGRVRILVEYEEDAHTSTNLAKAALAPGLSSYRFRLRSTLQVQLTLPGREPLTWQATSDLTRLYKHADYRDSAVRAVYDDVDRSNFLAVIHQMRADERLYVPKPEFEPL
jgi:hypothetical protein